MMMMMMMIMMILIDVKHIDSVYFTVSVVDLRCFLFSCEVIDFNMGTFFYVHVNGSLV